ncbi:hypothetical protein EGJ52_23740 [Pseudomonas luteola]|uniref:hypothetical protein n=1 Tax=Pseudomonas luteola TaxID=47886 RepID=UPI000F77B498|nr:hypothetical protein [Pseudomonas luteola]RRW39753.1 hypothetical protein EGJ52_23740 [Pseudomonas luteola]
MASRELLELRAKWAADAATAEEVARCLELERRAEVAGNIRFVLGFAAVLATALGLIGLVVSNVYPVEGSLVTWQNAGFTGGLLGLIAGTYVVIKGAQS